MFLKIKELSYEKGPYLRVQRRSLQGRESGWEVKREFIKANSRKRPVTRDCSTAKCYREAKRTEDLFFF